LVCVHHPRIWLSWTDTFVSFNSRSPQRWSIMVPALKEQYDITNELSRRPPKYSEYPQSLVERDFTWDAFEKLARREHAPLPAYLKLRRQLSTKASAIESLPAELLSMIFSDPNLSTEDIVALGLASQTLWHYVLAHIQRASSKAPWANTPLLCTGTYLTTLPEPIYVLDPESKWRGDEWYNHSTPRRGMCPARRWNWDARCEFLDRADGSQEDEYLKFFESLCEKSKVDAKDRKELRRSLAMAFGRSTIAPNGKRKGVSRKETNGDDRWVWRNLTTKEYVLLTHRKKFHHEDNYFHVKGMPSLSLDKAIIMRTIWSEDVLYAKGDIKRQAPWAAHCFDVVRFKEIETGKGWNDTTAEVVEQWRDLKA
jgi:hypothetical protein